MMEQNQRARKTLDHSHEAFTNTAKSVGWKVQQIQGTARRTVREWNSTRARANERMNE